MQESQAQAKGRGAMRPLFMLIGIAALAFGLLFIGQGSGYIPWPASSFMIGQTAWVYYGAAIAFVGAVFVIVSRR